MRVTRVSSLIRISRIDPGIALASQRWRLTSWAMVYAMRLTHNCAVSKAA